MSKVKEIKNVSSMMILVETKQGSVYLPSGGSLKNVDVVNLPTIRKFVEVKEDLTEVTPSNGRMRLNESK